MAHASQHGHGFAVVTQEIGLLAEISYATQLQRKSIHGVSEGIVTLTQVTQQNSQLAQHAASSSQELLAQSQCLEKAVSRFGLGEIQAAA